ncbi:VOC family protein [Paenibacillus sp. OAS669]|uniref:VOC family protein n=1 Tax=Paenibacillus sp. OAS669 TaxID=2663821 RepID=UPI00178B299C|nr:VOC family protein [Paenibacillus sp. OAS669]MBE1446979.1 putative enzyme related to lactoylglutathione lyase [Paenibacillus sp. OAS669]
MKLLQIRLLADDFKTSAAFYRDVLELPVGWYMEEMEYALFNNGETRIEVVSKAMMAEVLGGMSGESRGGEAGPSQFLLQFEVDDVDAASDRLKAKGAVCMTEPHDRMQWNSRIAHFRDPDGNLIEIYRMLS